MKSCSELHPARRLYIWHSCIRFYCSLDGTVMSDTNPYGLVHIWTLLCEKADHRINWSANTALVFHSPMAILSSPWKMQERKAWSVKKNKGLAGKIQPFMVTGWNKEFAIGNIVYSCTFYKEINCDGFFHDSEHSQHHFLCGQLRTKPFLYRRVNMFTLHGLSFRFRLVVANPCFAHL